MEMKRASNRRMTATWNTQSIRVKNNIEGYCIANLPTLVDRIVFRTTSHVRSYRAYLVLRSLKKYEDMELMQIKVCTTVETGNRTRDLLHPKQESYL